MEKYNMHVSHDAWSHVTECVSAHITNGTWLTVKALGDLVGTDLSDVFGNGDLGWSPATLLRRFQATETLYDAVVSVPKPEEIPACHDVLTVREQMEDLGNSEDIADGNDQLRPRELENVPSPEPNALFVTIVTDTFDPTLENVEAVRTFISDNSEGRDIHLRIM